MNPRKFFYRVILTASVVSLTGCDLIYRMLDKDGAQEQKIVGKILPYEPNAKVLEVQTLLKLYGYSIGTPDGVLGGRTRDILEEFQKDTGLKPSRFMDDATWAQLHIFEDNGLIIGRQLNVQRVQTLLQKAGFDPGSADGVMGVKSKKAVVQFQAAHQLEPDGRIGYQTLKALSELLGHEAPP